MEIEVVSPKGFFHIVGSCSGSKTHTLGLLTVL